MSDLWVPCEHGQIGAYVHDDEYPDCPGFVIASPAEILAAAANLDGAQIIPRCAEHGVEWVDGDMSWNSPGCWWARAVYVGVEDCRMVREVRIPLPDKETPDE